MGRVNTEFQELIAKKSNPEVPEFSDIIIETESDETVSEVIRQLGGIPNVTVTGSRLNFINAQIPTAIVERIAEVPGVLTVSYNNPVFIRQSPTIEDPFYGVLSLSPIEIPVTPAIAVFRNFVRTPMIPLGLLGVTVPRIFGEDGGPKADVEMIPVGETRKWMGVPEEDNKILQTPVAVLDTGLTLPHPMFHPTKGFIQQFSTTGEPPFDGLGHGQWCTSAAFGDSWDTRFGLCRGVADPEGGLLMHGKCLSNIGFGSSWSVIQAMTEAVNRGAKVISMSLGGPLQGSVQEDPQCRLIERFKDQVIFVIAAGNDGPEEWTIGSPGASPFALTVGAWSTFYNGPAIFSSRGPSGTFYEEHPDIWKSDLELFGESLIKPDVMAPGGGPVEEGQKTDLIYAAVTGWMDGTFDFTPGDGFDGMRGTSMATPHVAGLVGFALDRGVISSTIEIKRRMAATRTLQTGTAALGEPGSKNTTIGYGLINLQRLQG